MPSQILLFRYVELKTFGIELLLEGQNIFVVIRQPHKMPIKKVIPLCGVLTQKAENKLDATF